MSSKQSSGILPKEISSNQAKDTGMAMILICFIWLYFFKDVKLVIYPGILLLLNMTVPKVYTWPAKLWFGLSHAMGTVMTKVVLSVLFAVMVVPVGIVRGLMGIDELQLKLWKNGADSVFKKRDHLFTAEDMEAPY